MAINCDQLRHEDVMKILEKNSMLDDVEIVQLNSFGCGVDAVTTDQVEEITKKNITVTEEEVDDEIVAITDQFGSKEKFMEILKQTIISSLRSVDTGTRYSCSQYILLLMDTDAEHGRLAAERVIEKFYGNQAVAESGVKVSYDIQPLQGN